MNARELASLDNYITGHYGEDQFRGPITCDECLVEFDDYATFEEHECEPRDEREQRRDEDEREEEPIDDEEAPQDPDSEEWDD